MDRYDFENLVGDAFTNKEWTQIQGVYYGYDFFDLWGDMVLFYKLFGMTGVKELCDKRCML